MRRIFLLLLALLFAGCVESTKKGAVVHSAIERLTKQNYIVYDTKNLPHTVVILPFKSNNKEATTIVTKTFYNFFSPLPYQDIEPDLVQSLVKTPVGLDTPTKEIEKLAKEFSADGVIYGDVKNFDKLFLGLYSHTKVGAHIKFYSLKTHKIIWEFNDNAKKISGGVSLTPWGLAATIALSAYNLRKVQMYRAAEDLFRDIPKIIPHPKNYHLSLIPLPTQIIHSGMQKDIFGIGDTIIISLVEEPGLEIFAYIPGVAYPIELQEKTKGHYEGVYRVEPHVNAQGYIKFVAQRKDGTKRVFYDVVAPIHIDTKKPNPPQVDIVYTSKAIKIQAQIDGDEISQYVLQTLKNGKYEDYKISKNGVFVLKPINATLFIRIKVIDRAHNYNYSKPQKIYLYADKNVAQSKLYHNENIVDSIKRIEANTTISKLYISPSGYLIVMPHVTVTFANNADIVVDGGVSFLDAKAHLKNTAIIVRRKGEIKLLNTTLTANKNGIILKDSAIATINKSTIKSVYAALSLQDASFADVKNSIFITSKRANASVLITGNAKAIIESSKFLGEPIFHIMSNSTKKSLIRNCGKLKILGDVDVEN